MISTLAVFLITKYTLAVFLITKYIVDSSYT